MEMQHSWRQRHRPRLRDCNPYLTCGLCRGYLIDAVSNSACPHSFCRSCVLGYLEKGEELCPVCRQTNSNATLLTELSSDRLLQTIVYKVVPNLYGCEIQRRINFLNEFTDASSPSGDTSRRKERRAIRLQKNIYAGADRINLRLVRCDSMPFDFIESESLFEDLEEDTNQRTAKNERNEVCGQRRYLLCPVELTIGHLKKYIRFKFDMDETFEIEIYYTDKSLLDEYTLVDVAYIYIRAKVMRLTLYYVVFDNSANKPVCLDSECNNNSVTKSRNRKRKLELAIPPLNTENNGDEEPKLSSKKSRSQSYTEINDSNGDVREELGDGRRSEDNQEEISGSRSQIAFAVDSPADSHLFNESLEPNTDSNDLNCLNAGDASLAVAENSDIIAHITQNSAFSKTTGFFLHENNMPSSDVDLDGSKVVGGFLHSHFVEEIAVDRTTESDLIQQQREENDIRVLTEQRDLENSVSSHLTPEEIRKASDFYYANGNAVELRDYFQEDVNPVEDGVGVSAEHWLPSAADAVSQGGETANNTQTGGELSYPAETDPSKDSDAEIDTEIRRIAANVAISDENSMTDYGMNDDSESALPSPYPEPVENTAGDGGEARVIGGHRNIMDSIAISQLFSPSSSSSSSSAGVGISVGNFLVQNTPPFEFLVRSDGMSPTTLGLNSLSLNGHCFPNWSDYMSPMQQVQDSGFRIVTTESGTFPMLNSNFAAVGLPFASLSHGVTVSKLLSPGANPGVECFPVDSAQNNSVFPAASDIMASSSADDSCTNGCTPTNELCSSDKTGSVSAASLTSPFGIVCNTTMPEVLPVGLTRNDRDSSSGDIHCIGAVLEVDNIHLSRVQPSKMPDTDPQVSTFDQACTRDENKPNNLRSVQNSDTNGIFIDSGNRVNDDNIAVNHDSAQLCDSEHCSSIENVAKQAFDRQVHSILERSESAVSLSSPAHKLSSSATNTSIENATAISPVEHHSDTLRTEQHKNTLESVNSPTSSAPPLSSENNECKTMEDSPTLSGTSEENGEAILSNDGFECTIAEVAVSQSSETLISNGLHASQSSPSSVQVTAGSNSLAAESQTIPNTENSVENNSVPKENYADDQEGMEGSNEAFDLQRKPQNETVITKETAMRAAVKSATAGPEASCENQPGGKVSVGTQTNIDLVGRYFKRRVNPVNSFLAGKSSRSSSSSTSRDRSSKAVKTSVSSVTTSKSTTSTLSSTVNLSTGGSLTSQAAIFHISGHGAPILFPAVSPVTINGKSTFLITVPGHFSFPGQNGVRPNMTLIPTRLNYSNPRSAAIGLSAPLVLHQGTPSSQAMVIGRAVGPPLQLIVPPPSVSTAPVFESAAKDPQTPTAMMIPGSNRPGLVCRFTLNSNQPVCAMSTPTLTPCVSAPSVTSIGAITRSVCSDTMSSVSHSGMQAVSRPGKPGACVVASCSSVPHLTLSAATLPTFVLSNAPPLTFQNHNVLNGDPNPRTESISAKTPADPRASNKSSSSISSTPPSITCCSPLSNASSVQSSGSPASTASVFQKFPGARHIAISNIPHVGNKFSVARKGSDLRVPPGAPLPIPKSTVDLTDSQDTSTASTVPATSSTSDIRVSFQFDAKSGNYSLSQGQRIEGAPVSLIRAILERNLTYPVTKSTSSTPNAKPNNTISKSKLNDMSDASGQSPSTSGPGKTPHNDDESVESRNQPDCSKLSSPIGSPDKKPDRQDSDEMTEKDALAVRCKLSKTTKPTFFQGNGENASMKSGTISIPPGQIDACRMKAPRGPPLPSGVVTRSQRACGNGRVDDVSRGPAVPPSPSVTAMALSSSPNSATSRRRSAAEANINATTTAAKNKRRCSADTGPKLDNWTVASTDSSDPLSPSLAAVFTKKCSIGITRCAVAPDASSHTSRSQSSSGHAPVLVKASTMPGIFSKTSSIPESTPATSSCQVAFVTATTAGVSQPVESRCQTVTVSSTENGARSSVKNDLHSFGQSQAENGSGVANGTSKPGWVSMAVQTRCGMVALPKKAYAYFGSAMSHEHIAAREKNIDGQTSGLPCSASAQSNDEPTNGHARNTGGTENELKRATSHSAACYLSPNDDDLECQNTAPPINQLRRMCNHFQNGSREMSSPTADVELLPPRLSPFT